MTSRRLKPNTHPLNTWQALKPLGQLSPPMACWAVLAYTDHAINIQTYKYLLYLALDIKDLIYKSMKVHNNIAILLKIKTN